MIECLILGDSIAVGTGLYRPECKVLVQQGITSKGWNMSNVKSTLDANTVVISLGSNDYAQIDSLEELTKLRKRIHAEKVYWIIPAIKPDVQDIIENIAHENGDWIIQIPYLSNDGVHPTMQGYRKIAEITK
jgi:lysophospholipase L1-like esterase